MQTGDKEQYNGYRGKKDMQDEDSCKLLKGGDYRLRSGANRGAVREDICEPLTPHQLLIR
jgi:hypothetical protein